MPENQNAYEQLHQTLVDHHQRLEYLLTAKSECLESVQNAKFPATQLPKIMAALQHQHEWELRMTVALEQIIEVVGVAAEEANDAAPA